MGTAGLGGGGGFEDGVRSPQDEPAARCSGAQRLPARRCCVNPPGRAPYAHPRLLIGPRLRCIGKMTGALWLRYTPSPSAARELLAAPPLEHFHQEGTWTETAATAVSPPNGDTPAGASQTPLRGVAAPCQHPDDVCGVAWGGFKGPPAPRVSTRPPRCVPGEGGCRRWGPSQLRSGWARYQGNAILPK